MSRKAATRVDRSFRHPRFAPAIDRAMARVEIDAASGCWLWTGGLHSNGYGTIQDDEGRQTYVHRVVFIALVGSIPEGLELDHRCSVKRCCNLDHLEAVTHQENCARRGPGPNGWQRQEKCGRGHPLQGEDADVYIGSGGRRRCAVCRRDQHREGERRRRQRIKETIDG